MLGRQRIYTARLAHGSNYGFLLLAEQKGSALLVGHDDEETFCRILVSLQLVVGAVDARAAGQKQ